MTIGTGIAVAAMWAAIAFIIWFMNSRDNDSGFGLSPLGVFACIIVGVIAAAAVAS